MNTLNQTRSSSKRDGAGKKNRSLAPKTPLGIFALAFAILSVLSGCWAVASPLMSYPDEIAHVVKAAAVARGELTGTPDSDVGQTVSVQVPEWVKSSAAFGCYQFRPQATPSCAVPSLADPDATTTAVTTAGSYNPMYYAIVGLPSLVMSGLKTFYAMRLVSVILSCIFLAAMFMALSQLARKRWVMIAAVVSITPMVLFLNGGVNPNSLEFATTGAIFANLLLLLERHKDRSIYLKTVPWVVVGAAMLANTKGASLLWMLVAVVVVFLLAEKGAIATILRRPIVWAGIGVIGLSTLFAIVWIFSTNALQSKPYPGAGSTSFSQGFENMTDRTFDMAKGLIGEFGWLDTPAPTGVIWVWVLLGGVLIVGALAISRGRTLYALITAVASLLLLGPILQASVVATQGYIWQGRYVLALFIVVMLTAGVALDRSLGEYNWSRPLKRLVTVGIALLVVAQSYAFLWALRRYVVGIADGVYWRAMITAPQWQPPLGWIPVFVIFSLSLLATGIYLYRVSSNWLKKPAVELEPHQPAD